MYRLLLPNMFTVGNLFCAFLALQYVIEGRYVPAAWLVVLGAALDAMDGRIARFVGKDTSFGIEFDSLVDLCTFGIVPATMIYLSVLSSPWGLVLAFLYLLCGALRLARFNVLSHNKEKTDLFMGMPIPGAAIVLTQYVVFTQHAWETRHAALLAAVLVVSLAYLMVSRLAFDKVPSFRSSSFSDRFKQVFFLGTVALAIYPSTSKGFFFPLTLVYMASGIYRWVAGLFSDEVTQHA